ncbi:plastocyanin/azurin family copper-binding protein [Halobellus ordinarius]|uniref:plastocyanin/azurin family copper-binding protein n=1 Tax=Halobellus ordinarius TaxID=3075120 RepID=UPI0028805AF2|nr:plastocyanin/azurin family copper-binding protein [Halobellus sp. ZY16]
MGQNSNGVSRRLFLQTAAGIGAAGGSAGTAAAQDGATHTVDMTDNLVFDPDSITIAPGDTVIWETVGTIGHSVTAYEDEIPEEADYFASGGFDVESDARSAYSAGDPESGDVPQGETYRHTFEVEGTYEYFCIPHESVGMLGTVEVTPGGATTDTGGPAAPTVPDAAKSLLVTVTGAFVAVLSLTYVFLKYGGDYGTTNEDEG